jgi:formamidopyrimidine-DNA glycosylase
MPELPEVQTVVTSLKPRLRGRKILRVRLLRADIVTPLGVDFAGLLLNRCVAEISRRAKRIIFRFDNDHSLYFHLGMTGRLTIEAADAPVMPHTHLLVDFDDGQQLRFRDPRRFGGIWWLGAASAADDDKLGPEPLELKASELAARLSKTRRAIKTALLDQSLVAGIGNIYADEALYAARIHPLVPASKLTVAQVKALCAAIKRTLNKALHHKGSTLRDYRDADGNEGEFQKLHRVYDREGKPCARCGTLIVRQVIGGRSAHFCPVCQVMG